MTRAEKLRYAREHILDIQKIVKVTIFDGIVKELIDFAKEVLCYEATDETFNTYIYNNLVVAETNYKFEYNNEHFRELVKEPELYKRMTEYIKENKNISLTAFIIDNILYQIPQSFESWAYLMNRTFTFLNSILTELLHYSDNPQKMAEILEQDDKGFMINTDILANKMFFKKPKK